METQSDQAKLDESVLAELLEAPKTILGYQMQPVTLGTIALLQQLKSPLIMGVDVNSVDNMILDCCIFVRIQTLPIKEATRLVFGDKDTLIEAAIEMASQIPPSQIADVVTSIVSLLKDATSTRVSVVDAPTKKASIEDVMKGNG